MNLSTKLKNLLIVNGGLSFLGGLITPIAAAYLTIKGFSISEISIYLILSRLVSLLFETPSGIYSDKYGRIRVGQVSILLSLVFTVSLLLSSSFYWLISTSVFSGLFNAFNSGTFDVLLFNKLEEENNLEHFGKISSILSYFTSAGLLFGIAISIPIMLDYYSNIIGFRLILITAAIASIIILFFSLSLTEEKSASGNENSESIFDFLKIILNSSTYLIFISLMLYYVGYHSIERFFQVFLINNINPDIQLLLLSGIYFVATILSAHGAKLSDGLSSMPIEIRKYLSILISTLASTALYFSAISTSFSLVAIFKSVSVWLFAIVFTMYRKEILIRIDDHLRSTFASLINTIQSVSIFIGVGLIGIYSVIMPASVFLLLSLAFLIAAGCALAFVLCQSKSISINVSKPKV